jgi:branched-chain amino acid transport system ATP-binding protein
MTGESALEAHAVSVRYGKAVAVQSAGLTMGRGEITALVGPNGAGKTSLLHAIQGVIASVADTIKLDGRSILALSATERVKAGIVLVPQGRQLFRHMSVRDNLMVVANSFGIPRHAVDEALRRFPILKERQRSPAGVLSGGEQQMLALARALMCNPSVLVLDEPTLGLAPTIVKDLMEVIVGMRTEGKGILIAEPTTRLLPRELDRGYVMVRGVIVDQASNRSELERRYEAQYSGASRAH